MATNIVGVTMPTPASDPGISTNGNFTMGGVITTAGGGTWAESGDMHFQWDQGNDNWVTMGSTGALNVASQTNPITGLQTATEQQVTVYNDGTTGTFNIRVRLIEDDLTEWLSSSLQIVVSGGSSESPSESPSLSPSACGDQPQAGGGTAYECSENSNEVSFAVWIPANKYEVPVNFRILPE